MPHAGRADLIEYRSRARRAAARPLCVEAARSRHRGRRARREPRRRCGRAISAHRKCAVLHHHAHPLSRARRAAGRARVSFWFSARSPSASAAAGLRHVRRALGQRPVLSRMRSSSFASRPDRFNRRRKLKARRYASRRATDPSCPSTTRQRFRRICSGGVRHATKAIAPRAALSRNLSRATRPSRAARRASIDAEARPETLSPRSVRAAGQRERLSLSRDSSARS